MNVHWVSSKHILASQELELGHGFWRISFRLKSQNIKTAEGVADCEVRSTLSTLKLLKESRGIEVFSLNLVKACLLTVKKRRQEKLLFSYQEAVENVGKVPTNKPKLILL